MLTLSWPWAPVAVAATFLTIWAGHALVRAVARSSAAALGTVAAPLLRSALDRRPDPGAV